ncbi:hypothetical protein CC77DRAFT_1021706 [Alternaria alternata]|jgi:hypothetical protein|uniref:Uncharacterized protein n=1 Tax=Alternaria alternata TaxID=5599 RepID=A0A177DIZ4_ALTAL|nr:hypothetical protein CC77DRAFT_1021706 [Alternaria alternata]OAG18809.1 hypothetical protein CC77DRAFT_1021706 [Alternaria alternata]
MAYLNVPIETPSSTNISPTVPSGEDAPSIEHISFNYYLLFLGVPVALIALVYFRIYRHRATQRQNGQRTEARYVEGWPRIRSLVRGTYGINDSVVSRQPEGLNEHVPNVDVHVEDGPNENGEAPPPYQPKVEETEAVVAISLQALQMDETVRRETVGEQPPSQYTAAERTASTLSTGEEVTQTEAESGARSRCTGRI